MKKLIILLLAFCALLFAGNITYAQIPDEVLKPYRKYNNAIKIKDYEQANKAAYTAWKTAEKVLGQHKTTGDLALNYAILAPRVVTRKEHDLRDRAYLRSIELGQYHQGDVSEIILDRHLERLIYFNNTSIIKGKNFSRANKYISFTEMEAALDQYLHRGTWYEAVMEAIRTSQLKTKKEYQVAIESGQKSLSIFDSLDAKNDSLQKYQLILDLGKSYYQSSLHLEAGLVLQRNFHKIKNEPIPDKYIRQSERAWKLSWLEIYKSGELENAYNKGLCKCIGLEGATGRPEPILRIPPIMPAKSRRSGEAIVVFDVKQDGSTENIRIASYSEKIFGDAASKAAGKFIYTPNLANIDHKKRTNIPARFIFTLRGDQGKILPAKPLKTDIPVTVNRDMISEERTLITTGSRIRVR